MKPGLAAAAICLSMSGVAHAQLYSEAFDDAGADVKINQEADTFASFVDYSNMTVGSTNFSLPEAPRPVTGGVATRGLLLQANVTTGVTAALNVLAGATPMTFTGDYVVSFDAYLSISTSPLPTTGSTEQLLWGAGVDDTNPVESSGNDGSGTVGTWGWLTTENGSSTQDAAIYENDTELADLADNQPGESAPFNNAFDTPVFGPNNAAANSWVQVDIYVMGGAVRVLYNGVEFFNEASASTDGFAMLGYEDPFSSLSSLPDYQWGLFDNFVVDVPAPGAAAPLALLGLAAGRRRRAL